MACRLGGGPTMLTRMTDEDWATVLEIFRACRSQRGDKGRDDRKFLEAIPYFAVHNITWRALPAIFGNWNSIWKRFWRLSQAGVFEAFFEALASLSRTAHLGQVFDHPLARGQDPSGGAALGWWAPSSRRSRASAVRLISCRCSTPPLFGHMSRRLEPKGAGRTGA